MDPGTRRPSHEMWLEAEAAGQDELADLAFSRRMAGMPRVEPSRAFIARAVEAAVAARARRRAVTRLAWAAAAVLVAVASGIAVYVSGTVILGRAIGAVVVTAEGLVWLMATLGEGVRWWGLAGRVATAVGAVLASPQTTSLLVAIEVMGAMAIYAFHRVLQEETGARESEKAGI
jgi:hypothetical protein